tara:strand:+ start:923 stop:1210 length:288 start_codon:yes stop_codon:yes gene_type:complete
MIVSICNFLMRRWDFIFIDGTSSRRDIPVFATRHFFREALNLMWIVPFAMAIGSYTFLAVSMNGHAVLFAAAFITVTIWTILKAKSDLILGGSNR